MQIELRVVAHLRVTPLLPGRETTNSNIAVPTCRLMVFWNDTCKTSFLTSVEPKAKHTGAILAKNIFFAGNKLSGAETQRRTCETMLAICRCHVSHASLWPIEPIATCFDTPWIGFLEHIRSRISPIVNQLSTGDFFMLTKSTL